MLLSRLARACLLRWLRGWMFSFSLSLLDFSARLWSSNRGRGELEWSESLMIGNNCEVDVLLFVGG